MNESALPSRFLFLIVQPEATPWVKAELRKAHPELCFAYSRPGLLTFKHPSASFDSAFVPKTHFARHYGFSLGSAKSVAEVFKLLEGTSEQARLHVYARDEGEGKPRASAEVVAEIRRDIFAGAPTRFYEAEASRPGDLVINVIVPPPGDAIEPWLVGWHRHDRNHSALPGGVTRLTLNELAPSRAWLKLEELIRFARLPVRSGQCAVEIGCAPGGAVLSLVDRGVSVIGIDPGEIAPSLLAHVEQVGGSFTHLACPVSAVKREQLPARVDWLLCDANLAPTVTIRYLAYWSKQLRPALRGIVFTLKLNDDRMVEALPRLLARCGEFGFGPPRAVQLPSHRRELAVLCTRSGK